jgi:ketosteroid isomerase-like protein
MTGCHYLGGSGRAAVGPGSVHTMSQTPIGEVLRSYAEAWEDGDLARVLDLYHPDFVLHYFGESPLAGTHQGKDAAIAVLAQATATSGRVLVRVVDRLVGERLGALVVVERLGPAGSQREVQRILVYRTEDGKLRECWLFDEDQRFVDRLWSGQDAAFIAETKSAMRSSGAE